ncbi:uncharacterized protein LOC108114944 [Drosophila eugracilis]|uniref:uncharacterized protein LOC108114944 n=1 Tax=Drosophila eugracilis TaxID=29029 RepID=UPI0007E78B90|nr:uncharacterized protein LOC108114944 [Drosophila eugracilis]
MVKTYWNPRRPIRPVSEMAEKNIFHRSFTPTYEQEEPQMGLILSWHYGRQWLEERDCHEKKTKKMIKTEANFIPPDYTRWLERRKRSKTRQQLLQS